MEQGRSHQNCHKAGRRLARKLPDQFTVKGAAFLLLSEAAQARQEEGATAPLTVNPATRNRDLRLAPEKLDVLSNVSGGCLTASVSVLTPPTKNKLLVGKLCAESSQGLDDVHKRR